MNVHEAYKKLGLEPLDDFLIRRGPAETRRIGATTWMLVEAALALLEGKDVILVGHNMAYADDLVRSCIHFLDRLGGTNSVKRSSKAARTILFDPPLGNLYWDSERTLEGSLRGRRESFEIFSDQYWKLRVMDRQKGPFACIRKIERIEMLGGRDRYRYEAYDDRGVFLLELTEEGALLMEEQEGMRIERVNW